MALPSWVYDFVWEPLQKLIVVVVAAPFAFAAGGVAFALGADRVWLESFAAAIIVASVAIAAVLLMYLEPRLFDVPRKKPPLWAYVAFCIVFSLTISWGTETYKPPFIPKAVGPLLSPTPAEKSNLDAAAQYMQKTREAERERNSAPPSSRP